MSEQNGTAPSLEGSLGLEDDAALHAERAKAIKVTFHRLRMIQEDEGLTDDDAAPGFRSEPDGEVEINGVRYRSIRQQKKRLEDMWKRRWKRIEQDGLRANVDRILSGTQ